MHINKILNIVYRSKICSHHVPFWVSDVTFGLLINEEKTLYQEKSDRDLQPGIKSIQKGTMF